MIFLDKGSEHGYRVCVGTHLAKTHRGIWVQTACGKMIDKRAIALAKTKGKVAYVDVHEVGYTAAWIIAAINVLCPKCLANSSGVEMLSEAVINRCKQVREIHVEEHTDEAVEMCCGKIWAMESLFRNDVGFITVSQLLPYMADDHSPNAKLCKECLDHPRVQLHLLANVEL